MLNKIVNIVIIMLYDCQNNIRFLWLHRPEITIKGLLNRSRLWCTFNDSYFYSNIRVVDFIDSNSNETLRRSVLVPGGEIQCVRCSLHRSETTMTADEVNEPMPHRSCQRSVKLILLNTSVCTCQMVLPNVCRTHSRNRLPFRPWLYLRQYSLLTIISLLFCL